MSYKAALKECHKVGTNHATGDSLRAMYAALIAQMHGGSAEKYFEALQVCKTDDNITQRSRELLRDRQTAWDVLIA